MLTSKCALNWIKTTQLWPRNMRTEDWNATIRSSFGTGNCLLCFRGTLTWILMLLWKVGRVNLRSWRMTGLRESCWLCLIRNCESSLLFERRGSATPLVWSPCRGSPLLFEIQIMGFEALSMIDMILLSRTHSIIILLSTPYQLFHGAPLSLISLFRTSFPCSSCTQTAYSGINSQPHHISSVALSTLLSSWKRLPYQPFHLSLFCQSNLKSIWIFFSFESGPLLFLSVHLNSLLSGSNTGFSMLIRTLSVSRCTHQNGNSRISQLLVPSLRAHPLTRSIWLEFLPSLELSPELERSKC